MLFNSYIFIFIFLPIALIGWYGLNKLGQYKLASLFLSAMSLWFYAYFNVRYLAIILCSIGLNFFLSFLIAKIPAAPPTADDAANQKKPLPPLNRIGLFAGLLLNLGILFYFKY